MITLSGRVAGRASRPSRSRDNDGGGGLQYVLWKSVRSYRVFLTKGIYRWKGDVRGWTKATLWCGRLLVRLRLSSRLHLPFR
jgi:hypothetical protein